MHHVVAPGPHFPPAVEHRHPLEAIGGGALDVVVEGAEFLAHALHAVSYTHLDVYKRQKPLSRRVVSWKANADDEERKTRGGYSKEKRRSQQNSKLQMEKLKP